MSTRSLSARLSRLSLLGLFAAGLMTVAGTTGCKKPEYPACKKNKHCNQEMGEKCVDGTCQNCVETSECAGKGPNGEDYVCYEYRCVDPSEAAAGGSAQGSPCTSSLDCTGGLVCKAGVCDFCAEDMDCPAGTCDLGTGLCSDGIPGSAGSCMTDDDCAIDEICDAGMCIFSGDYGGDGEVLCELSAVFFGFDSPQLTPETQEKLKTAAQCIADQGRLVYLEAHADPRGTEEYNILLTDKRGQGVKKYLLDLGVPAENMQVISKGSLEARGTDEQSYADDRRVEFIWQ
ncbi:OmpA family protein [Pseudenhygromyxa sp. WMMC2535]|uniref:OmpA family protein n=1 Tax=Pseudenhygromyxa sp. WMMC2535 TaxID=2712867 RepID=UPI00155800CC|nr:OmpA family protein [Pseudenhygromyxa sp. WMMC2535]NVB37785.1 OmpA family protein [Pseudenhygromyxa sp. WMMC2535]